MGTIKRQLPRTDNSRRKALNTAKTKMTTPGPDGNFLTTATQNRLNVIQPDFNEAVIERGLALAVQAGTTEGVEAKKKTAQQYISHFIQVFNLGVARGKYPKAHRAYYQLDVNSDKLPPIGTEQDVALWGQNVVDGDALRTGAGGEAMSNPEATEVADALDEFNTANQEQSTRKDEYDAAQETVENLREEADKVIKKVWDEVETFYNEESPSSKRSNAREWGVVYVSDVPLTFHITVTDGNTSLPLEGAEAELLETGNTAVTNAAGQTDLVSNISADECTFKFSKAGYTDFQLVVPLTTDTEYFVSAVLT